MEKDTNTFFIKLINKVEKIGNKLPHPFFLFVYLSLAVFILSFLMRNVSSTYTTTTDGQIIEKTVSVLNLFSVDYIRDILKNWVSIYTNFAPLGIVMVMMLAIGFAQYTGLFDAFMKGTLAKAPAAAATFVLAVVGATASVASNAGIIFGAAIGAALFASLGRNPILGCITGYAAAHGGFSAALVPCGTDVLLASITQATTEAMGIDVPVHPLINYFFVFISTFTVALAVTYVSEKIMIKVVKPGIELKSAETVITKQEKRGLRIAGIGLVVFFIVLLALTIPGNSFFRSENGSLFPASPLIDSIVALLFIFFIVAGAGYGIGAGTIKSKSDVVTYMGKGLSDSLSFFVMAFPAAMFIRFFNDSSIASIVAIKGAEFLKHINLTGIPLILLFILFCIICNLFMTSATSKWMILAPIFVPMFYQAGFSPALTLAAYRVADSASNPIAPINFFLPIVLGIMNRYKRPEDSDYSLGTLISYMLPYSLAILAVLVLQLLIWMLFKLPLGPATPIY